MVRGKLIVLEGIDGSGKTTQTKMLVARLKREGYAVETIDFPQYYTTFFGKMVAQYLRGEFGALDQVSPYLAAILYAGDRFERKEQLEQWLAEGKIVIANRYVSANMGHQASKIPRSKRAVFVQWLDQLEYGVFRVPRADRIFFLHVPTKIAHRLIDQKAKEERRYAHGRKRDIHEQSAGHLLETEKAFLELCHHQPEWKMIECTERGKILFPEEIHGKVWNAIQEFLQPERKKRGE